MRFNVWYFVKLIHQIQEIMTELEEAGWKKAREKTADQVC